MKCQTSKKSKIYLIEEKKLNVRKELKIHCYLLPIPLHL